MHHRVIRSTLVALVTIGMLAGSTGPALARSSREKIEQHKETGWPWDHQPDADPPATGVVESFEPQPEGMTDSELAIADPQAYATLIPECREIEAQLRARRTGQVGDTGELGSSDEIGAVSSEAVAQATVSAPYSPFAYLRFILVPGTGSMTYNGYRGTLYFRYGYYVAISDSYRWYTVAFPAISGNNIPRYQAVRNVGPIPEYTWDFGFLYGSYRGYESDYRTSFYPGKWRLDPWTGGPYDRGYLEVHGGTGDRYFKPTSGCIRLTPTSISSLRWYHAYRMANKYDRGSAHLYVDY